MKGRTVVLREYLKPLEILEFDLPDPEPGAIVLRVLEAGLCGSDLHTWRGDQMTRRLPAGGRPMGHEGVGVVYSLGRGASTDFQGNAIKEGDRLIFSALYACGRCGYCLSGDVNLCPSRNLTYRAEGGQHPYFVNTYSDFVYLPPSHPVFRVPAEVTDDEAVSVNCAMGTVLQGLTQAGFGQGQSLLVQGAGGLGLYAIALARDLGASQVIAVDGQAPRLQLAREMGADAVVDINEATTPDARVSMVMDATNGRGVDVVMELVGLGELVAEGIDMLAPGGAFVEIGNLMQDRTATIRPAALLRNKRVLGSVMYRPSLLPTALDFVVRNRGKAPLGRVISHHYPLADINAAFGLAEWSGRTTDVIRAAITP